MRFIINVHINDILNIVNITFSTKSGKRSINRSGKRTVLRGWLRQRAYKYCFFYVLIYPSDFLTRIVALRYLPWLLMYWRCREFINNRQTRARVRIYIFTKADTALEMDSEKKNSAYARLYAD